MGTAVALAGAARTGVLALAAIVFVLQLALAYGWSRAMSASGQGRVGRASEPGSPLTGTRVRAAPGPLDPAAVGVAAAAITDAVLLARLAPVPLASPLLGMGATQRVLALVLALMLPAVFGRQILRGAACADAAVSVAAAVTGAVLTFLTAHWVIAAASGSGAATVSLAVLCAGAAATIATHILAWRPATAAAIIVLGAGPVGAWIGSLSPLFGVTDGAVLGYVAGFLASAGYSASSYVRTRWDEHVLLAAALPFATVAPAAYFLGRLLPG